MRNAKPGHDNSNALAQAISRSMAFLEGFEPGPSALSRALNLLWRVRWGLVPAFEPVSVCLRS